MKKLSTLAVALVTSISAYAQKYVPQIKQGTEMQYSVSLDGEKVSFDLTVNSIGDSVKLKWTVADYGTGNFSMSAKSLESGSEMYLKAPKPDADIKMDDTQTMGFISKSAFNKVTKNQQIAFGDLKYALNKTEPGSFKIAGRELDVVHLVAVNGKSELWVLNNPDYPLICKTKNGDNGVDLELDYIK